MADRPVVSRVVSTLSRVVDWLRALRPGAATRPEARRPAAIQISHVEDPWRSAEQTPLLAAADYVRSHAVELGAAPDQLAALSQKISFSDPRDEGAQLRFGQQKDLVDASTIVFNQTWLNVPVWRAAITLTLKHNPFEVLMATSTLAAGVDAPLPPADRIEAHRSLFALAAARREVAVEGMADKAPDVTIADEAGEPDKTETLLAALLGDDSTGDGAGPEAIRGRFYIYRYRSDDRCRASAGPPPDKPSDPGAAPSGTGPSLDLPPVDPAIAEGAWRLVSEVTFRLDRAEIGELNWRALIDVESDSVLLLEPLTSGLNGLVFLRDPITATGDSSLTPDRPAAILNPHRASVPLPHLDPPVDGVQALKGRFAWVSDVNPPGIEPPTLAAGQAFDFDARTNEFAAVNAYFHTDAFFSLVESLGFPIQSYFDHTSFPVRVDHRDFVSGTEDTSPNAHCVDNGTGGIGYAGYSLSDVGDKANPIGRACDSRVHFHELGGHGILYEHVGSANFGFAHSAGDSLSAIYHDPESKAADRFRYAPWIASNDRRFDRKVAEGWAWGGQMDDLDYGSEQILSTTLFRIYRAIGGDSADLAQKRFASRSMLYLILRAVSTLTPATNPEMPGEFANALMTADLLDWTSEKLAGGAYTKVIRWAFEKQGLYQPEGGMDLVTTEGRPPAVDVYIDDGRGGEYGYQPVYWDNRSIWNRLAADSGQVHQDPVPGRTNFAYVRLRNRGTQPAANVRLRGFHQRPGGGTVWPADYTPLETAGLNVAGTLAPNNSQTWIVGPFHWTPAAAASGGDSLLFAVAATGDSTNLDRFAAPTSIDEGRLVPHDNNIGLRRVKLGAPGTAPPPTPVAPPPPKPPVAATPAPQPPAKRGFWAWLLRR
jgi:hypothetical protein